MDRTEAILRDAEILYNFHASFSHAPEKADLILAAGSHDMRVPERAAELFLQSFAPLILCTGGFGKITDGLFREPEGVLFAGRCLECGVPADSILIEQCSTNTGENFSFSRVLASQHGLSPQKGIIVCKPYMSARAWATGTKQWPEVSWQVSAPPIPFAQYIGEDTPLEQEIELLVGDLQRLRVYAEKGFQAPVEIPGEIREAYERLVRAGFDRYILRD